MPAERTGRVRPAWAQGDGRWCAGSTRVLTAAGPSGEAISGPCGARPNGRTLKSVTVPVWVVCAAMSSTDYANILDTLKKIQAVSDSSKQHDQAIIAFTFFVFCLQLVTLVRV